MRHRNVWLPRQLQLHFAQQTCFLFVTEHQNIAMKKKKKHKTGRLLVNTPPWMLPVVPIPVYSTGKLRMLKWKPLVIIDVVSH